MSFQPQLCTKFPLTLLCQFSAVSLRSVDDFQPLPLLSVVLVPPSSVMFPPVPLDHWFLLLYVMHCSLLFMASSIRVHKLLGGFCPPDLCGPALPRMWASGQGPVSGVNRVSCEILRPKDFGSWQKIFPRSSGSSGAIALLPGVYGYLLMMINRTSRCRRLFLYPPSPLKLVLELSSLRGFHGSESQLSLPLIKDLSLHPLFGWRFVVSLAFLGS